MKYSESGLGGNYKITQNYLKETRPDGTEFIRFTPVPPYETAPCIDALCENYRVAAEKQTVDPLLLIPVFIHDFLCIHPFNDGNGRMSRLLTLLLLYRSGYMVGRYISIEKHIEKTKGAYYDALEEASQGWHEQESNPAPFIKYMLGIILACYREFEDRVEAIAEATVVEVKNGKAKTRLVKSKAYDIVRAAVDSKLGKFTKRDIVCICSSISEKSVEAALKKLLDKKYIERHGAERNTFYSKCSYGDITEASSQVDAKDGFPIGTYFKGDSTLTVEKNDNVYYTVTVKIPTGSNTALVYNIKAYANGSKMYYSNAAKTSVTYDAGGSITDTEVIDYAHEGTFDASDASYTWTDTEGTTVFVPWIGYHSQIVK
ncbi:Fic/DOC family protein [Ruminococcaceae bacterium FB2012]|nr:Fic/DOC family protein [Ruminococcaceae bacterium FB2012]